VRSTLSTNPFFDSQHKLTSTGVHTAFCYTTQHSGANGIISRPVHAHLSDCEKCAHNLLPRAIIIAICNHCLVYMTHNLTQSHNCCRTQSLPYTITALPCVHRYTRAPFPFKNGGIGDGLEAPPWVVAGYKNPPSEQCWDTTPRKPAAP